MKPVGNPWQQVSLPLLGKLAISNTSRTSLFLLHYIMPSQGCSLVLSTQNNIYRNLSPKDVDDMSIKISRYVENFLSVHSSSVGTLKLGYNSRLFFLEMIDHNRGHSVCITTPRPARRRPLPAAQTHRPQLAGLHRALSSYPIPHRDHDIRLLS